MVARAGSAAKPGKLAFDHERRDPHARQPQHAFEEEVARLPARRELRVEPVQALDLEERIAERDDAPQQSLGARARPLEQPAEGGEVERELLDPAGPPELDRADDEELDQAVRGLAV